MDYRDVAMRKNVVLRNGMYYDNNYLTDDASETFQCENWSCLQVTEWLKGNFIVFIFRISIIRVVNL